MYRGQKLLDATSEVRAKCFFIQRLSVAIQIGNAAPKLGTIPNTQRLDDIFIRPHKNFPISDNPNLTSVK